jgi:hypothetical protein
MRTITITLVQTADGLLSPRTRSDAWNLMQIIGPRYRLHSDRNSIAVKRLRRIIKRAFGDDFKIVIGRGCVRNIVERPSRQEAEALGPELVAMLCPTVVGHRAK